MDSHLWFNTFSNLLHISYIHLYSSWSIAFTYVMYKTHEYADSLSHCEVCCITPSVHQVTGDQSHMYHCTTQCAQTSGLSPLMLSRTSDGSSNKFCIRCIPRKKPRHSSLCTPERMCVYNDGKSCTKHMPCMLLITPHTVSVTKVLNKQPCKHNCV